MMIVPNHRRIYPVTDEEINSFQQAFTHTSWAHENGGRELSNERLEFFGDAILGMVISEYLFYEYSDLPEGDLSRLKSELVREAVLAQVALELSIPDLIRLGQGAQNLRHQPSVLADTVEAVIGWIASNYGLAEAIKWVLEQWERFLTEIEPELNTDYKGILQENVQRRFNCLPQYSLLKTSGPDHDKRFVVAVEFAGNTWGQGVGKSKKQAEQQAAKKALTQLEQSG